MASSVYQLAVSPFPSALRDISKKELRDFFEWFQEWKPARISQLREFVNAPGDGGEFVDFSPESLVRLDSWYPRQVRMRPRFQEEVEEIRKRLVFPVEIPDEELTDVTLSVAIDVGIYFGEVVVANIPGTAWSQLVGSKRNADYGAPVILGFGKAVLNPLAMCRTLAYGISRGKSSRLRELFDVWAGMAEKGSA
jgi:hypothetical protein